MKEKKNNQAKYPREILNYSVMFLKQIKFQGKIVEYHKNTFFH